MLKTALRFGLLLGLVLGMLKILELSFFAEDLTLELYLGLVGVAFLGLGTYLGWKFGGKPETEVVQVETGVQPLQLNADVSEDFGLSDREKEVLLHIAEGLSNQEIADKLFVSLNTVKTHTKNIYSKLDVRRRTQAVSKAKELRILR